MQARAEELGRVMPAGTGLTPIPQRVWGRALVQMHLARCRGGARGGGRGRGSHHKSPDEGPQVLVDGVHLAAHHLVIHHLTESHMKVD